MANNQASDIIETAFNEALKIKFDDHMEGDILVEWVIIGLVTGPEGDSYAYPMLFSNGGMPNSHARGLLHTGLKMVDSDELQEGDS